MIQTPDPDVSWSSSSPKEVLSEVLCHSWACLYYKISLSSSASLSKAYSPGLLKVAWLLRLTQMFGLQGWKLGWRSGKEIPLWAAVGRRVSIECGRRKEQKTGVNWNKNTEEKRFKKFIKMVSLWTVVCSQDGSETRPVFILHSRWSCFYSLFLTVSTEISMNFCGKKQDLLQKKTERSSQF